MIKIGRFIDNRPLQTTVRNFEPSYTAYAKVRDNYEYLAPKRGDKLPIKRWKVQVVTAATKWIELSTCSDGMFAVTNGRNGFSRTYKPKR